MRSAGRHVFISSWKWSLRVVHALTSPKMMKRNPDMSAIVRFGTYLSKVLHQLK